MHYVVVLQIFQAVIVTTSEVQIARVNVIQDAREDFAELATVKFCRFPIAQNKPALQGDELIEKLAGKECVQRRSKLTGQRLSIDERHAASY